MFLFSVSQGIKEFCEVMVANPQDWIQGDCRFMNTKHRDVTVWTANGLFFIRISGNEGLTLFEKWKVLNAVKLTTARKLSAISNDAASDATKPNEDK